MLWSKVTYCTEKCWTEKPCLSSGCQRSVSGNRELKDGSQQTSLTYLHRAAGKWSLVYAYILYIHTLYKILHDSWVLNLPEALFVPHRNFRGCVPMLDSTWEFLYPDCFHRHRHLTCLPAKLSVVCVPKQGLTCDITRAFKGHMRGHMFVYNMCV